MRLPPLEIFTFEQYSEEYWKTRAGIITASEFHSVLAKSKRKRKGVRPEADSRLKYKRTLVGELAAGYAISETFSTAATRRGREQEDEARKLVSFREDVEIELVGFMRRGRLGLSPDGIIPAEKATYEGKTRAFHLHIELLERDTLPPQHEAQVQGSMWIADAERCLFASYCRGLPPFIRWIDRNEEYIKLLERECFAFELELRELMKRLKLEPKNGPMPPMFLPDEPPPMPATAAALTVPSVAEAF